VKGHQSQETEVHRLRLGALWVLMTSLGSRCLQTIPYFEEVLSKYFLCHGLVVDLNALPDEAKMWAGVQSNTRWQTFGMDAGFGRQVLGQDRGDERRSAAFAFGAGYMDGI
jgi:hypothetical protein